MGESSRLRLCDVTLAHRIENECRELWADPAAWRRHLVVGAGQLTGMAVVHYAEFELVGSRGVPVPLCRADVGWRDETARMAFKAATAAHPNTLKFFPGFDRHMPRLMAGEHVVARRIEMCPTAEWRRTSAYNQFRRPAYLDDNAISAIQRDNGVVAVLDVSQDIADRPTTTRTGHQLALLHGLIGPLIGSVLATDEQRGMQGLSPQLRATLDRILAGQSEKAIAASLGVRHSTIHEYVGKIYRHFGVRSRAELMAYFIRRRPTSR